MEFYCSLVLGFGIASSGTVTVMANKIEMDVKSHFGSTLKLTYTGDMTVKSGAPQKAMSPMKSHNVLNF